MKRLIFVAIVMSFSTGPLADDSYQEADAKLNKTYQVITKKLNDDPDTKKLLVQAQRDWLRFRDSECALRASTVTGGSIYPMIMGLCLTEMTEKRVKDLEYYAACEEGDLSCPIPQ